VSRPKASWGPAEVLLGVGVFLAALFVALGVLGALSSAAGIDSNDLGFTILSQALVAAIFLGTAISCAAPGGRGRASLRDLGLRRFRPRALGWMALGYLVYWVFAVCFALLVTSPNQEDIAKELGSDTGVLGAIASGLLVVVAAPVSEEVFFRGFMFAGLRARMPFGLAASITGVIFGLSHSPTGITAVPQLTVLGLVLAWLYEKTGSLWPPILVHLTNNAIAFIVTGL
jgi:membrane protease YdiL (CAAX protease family)